MERDRSLDGIRGLAIGLVLVGHLDDRLVAASYVGVGLFFVLSGYLITGVLYRSKSRRRFYLHRAARLLPALAILLVVMAWAGAWRDFAASGLYVANWPFALGASLDDHFGHTWSLAIEEQFYLIWPWVLVLFTPRLAIALALASIGLRFIAPTNELAYYATFTRLDGLLLGAALAMTGWRLGRRWAFVAAGLVLVMAVSGYDPRTFRLILTATTLAGAVLIASPPAWISPLAPLGRISYSLYLFHYPLLGAFGPIGLLAAIPLATVSTLLLEEPIRRWVRLRADEPAGHDSRHVEPARAAGLGGRAEHHEVVRRQGDAQGDRLPDPGVVRAG